jgi:Na+-transporting NADH:ubiquinone oxidoreductase subunit C
MKDSTYTVVFAVVLGVVCAVLLTAIGQFTQPYREKNAEAEITRNILGVLEISAGENPTPEQMIETFKTRVKIEKDEKTGKERYLKVEDGKTTAVALEFSGPGLWGPVFGYLAVDGQLKTIKGISFYKHEETPGLGGEIDTDWFRDQFKGKDTKRPDGTYGVTVCVGGKKASGNSEVDGITGATLTSVKVQAMLEKVMNTFAREVK